MDERVQMGLSFRPAEKADHPRLMEMVIDAFEPITWYRKVDERYGPPGGCDWRELWRDRMAAALAEQILLVGEEQGAIVAYASGTYNEKSRIGLLDLLAVDRGSQGKSYGREMLRAFLDHLKGLGAEYANLECLTDNDAGNALYRAEGFEEVARSIRWFKRL